MASQLIHEQQQQQPQRPKQSVELFKYSKRVPLKSILGREDGGAGLVGERVIVGGWVKSRKEKSKPDPRESPKVPAPPVVRDVSCSEVLMNRMPFLRCVVKIFARPPAEKPHEEPDRLASPSVTYLRIDDGSGIANLMIMIDAAMSLVGQVTSTGTSILVEGVLEKPSLPGKHLVELKAEKILHVGVVDAKKYPLAKTKLLLESTRAYPHLRARTSTVASITRIRNALFQSSHMFFQNNGFLHVHMPTITTTDMSTCNKMFQVTTLLRKSDNMETSSLVNDQEAVSLDAVKVAIKEKSNRIEELKRSESNREALIAALRDLQKANELALQLEGQRKSITAKTEMFDFSKDFFSRPAYLSISSRLHLESYACALSSVYTIGPIFQAENSEPLKHLAEMWMVEVELAFAELEDVMNCAEDFLKFVFQSVSENCSDDIKLVSKRIDKNCISRLHSMGSTPFARITYAEAFETLKKVSDKTFKTEVKWGINLSDEHERYLADEMYKCPIIIYEFPKEAKPFYVRTIGDGRTVSAFDIIIPKVGVLIRGSQREERIDVLTSRISEIGLPQEQYEWYLDLRRHGTVKHSGFSLALEHMVMFATGLEDIRDAIPFPRTCGYASA